MNKKSNLLMDMIVFMIVGTALLVFCGVMVYVSWATYGSLSAHSDSLQNVLSYGNVNNVSANASQIIDATVGKVGVAYQSLPTGCLILIVGLVLQILVTSFLVRTNPIWFVAYVFVLAIDVIVAVPISNAYEMILNNPVLGGSFSGFMSVNWIWLHLPVWVCVVGFLAGILLFVNVNKAEVVY